MSSLAQFTDDFKLPHNENEIMKFWSVNKVYKKIVKKHINDPIYSQNDGPPFVSGKIHMGHSLISYMKSLNLNFWSMHGQNVTNMLGFDTHGEPSEQLVSKLLGLSTSDDIRKYGVANFNQKCEDEINNISNSWEPVFDRIGRFIDYSDQYKTMDFKFMESVWWAIKQLWDKDLIYKGFKIMPYSTALGTVLSNSMASDNYKDVEDTAVYVKFAMKNEPNCYFICWTTTPWTLPTNLALAMNPKMEYVKVKDVKTNEYYIMATHGLDNLYGKLMLSPKFDVVSKHSGLQFKDVEYVPLFNYYSHRTFKVIMGDFVDNVSGSGIVHMSPAHGEDDFNACIASKIIKLEEVGEYCPLDDNGRYISPVNDYLGLLVTDPETNNKIINRLKEEGKLMKKEKYKHSYPHCWRTDTPLIYRAVTGYFVRVTAIKERMIQLNEKVTWVPENTGSGRFYNWVKDAKDWCISRSRFFGTPIPIWASDDGEEMICVGSVDELVKLANLKERPTNLHPQHIQHIKIPSNKGNGMLSCIPYTLDCWFESGSVPFAQFHYPFENQTQFDNQEYLCDVVIEGVEQTKNWFYNLMVLSTAIFDKPAFKNVVCAGLILAPDGKKFSKRHGNGVSPLDLCDQYGSDAMRLYLTGSPAAHADSLLFDESKITEISGKYYQWLNAVKFFIEHTTKFQKDGNKFDLNAYKSSQNIMDRWILTRLRTTLMNIEDHMAKYTFYKVKAEILEFIEELINWYIKFNRNRLKGRFCDKVEQSQALSTLYRVLYQFTMITAPFAPFLAETFYQKLKVLTTESQLSVHLCDYPKPENFPEDPVVERQMKNLQLVSRLVRSLRMKSKNSTSAKVPLKHVILAHHNPEFIDDLKAMERYMMEEINAMKIIYSADHTQGNYVMETNPKELGLKYRKQSNDIKTKLLELPQTILETYEKEKGLTIKLGDQEIVVMEPAFIVKKELVLKLTPTEIGLIENDVSVIVDFEQSEDVVELYTKRLFIVAIQQMRKNTKLRPWNKIGIYIETSSSLIKNMINKFSQEIEQDLLYPVKEMKDRIINEKEIVTQKCDVNGIDVTITITDAVGDFGK